MSKDKTSRGLRSKNIDATRHYFLKKAKWIDE